MGGGRVEDGEGGREVTVSEQSAESLEREQFREQLVTRIPISGPVRALAALLGSLFVVGGLFLWVLVAIALVQGDLFDVLDGARLGFVLTVSAMPLVGALMIRSAFKGRDLLDEYFTSKRIEKLDRADD